MTDTNFEGNAQAYRFGGIELNLASRELRRGGAQVPVQRKVLDLLIHLVEHRDRAISKDDLMAAVWPDTVVTDGVLTSAVRKARQALGEDAEAIRTVHGYGYRLVADVSIVCGEDVRDASQRSAAGVTAERPSIAVLPFVNLSGDPGQEYFADAVTGDITTLLAKHRWLDVIARNTVVGCKESGIDSRTLAGELGARYLVEGSIRRAGNRIRVTAELIDALTGRHLWGDIYERDLVDVFVVQDDITRTIVGRLEPAIGVAERQKAAQARHPDLRAWELFHLGMARFYRFTAEGNAEAQQLLERARDIDPGFGEAHAWWAYATVLGMVYWDTEPSDELLDRALDATQQALLIDDQNAVFYALKARVQLARCDYGSALEENEIAVRLNPTLAVAYCGLGDSLAYEGRYEEAVDRFETAISLSPNDPQRWAFLSYGALALLFKQDYEAALAWADRALEVPNCQHWALAHRVVALVGLGREVEARQAWNRLLTLKPEFSVAFARRKLFFIKRPEQINLYLGALERAGG